MGVGSGGGEESSGETSWREGGKTKGGTGEIIGSYRGGCLGRWWRATAL